MRGLRRWLRRRLTTAEDIEAMACLLHARLRHDPGACWTCRRLPSWPQLAEPSREWWRETARLMLEVEY